MSPGDGVPGPFSDTGDGIGRPLGFTGDGVGVPSAGAGDGVGGPLAWCRCQTGDKMALQRGFTGRILARFSSLAVPAQCHVTLSPGHHRLSPVGTGAIRLCLAF